MPVWDLAVRLLHGSLLVTVSAAWLTASRTGLWHERAGYAAAAAVALRIAWGFAGSGHARFSSFVRSPAATAAYADRVLARGEPRYLGHNPLGALMVLALLAVVAALGFTGWLYAETDLFWGAAWLDQLHGALAWLLLGLVGLHVAGVLFTSVRHGENLVRSMIDGTKPAPSHDDID